MPNTRRWTCPQCGVTGTGTGKSHACPDIFKCPACNKSVIVGATHICAATMPIEGPAITPLGPKYTKILEAIEGLDRKVSRLEGKLNVMLNSMQSRLGSVLASTVALEEYLPKVEAKLDKLLETQGEAAAVALDHVLDAAIAQAAAEKAGEEP